MKLKINSGMLDVEFADGLGDLRKHLNKLAMTDEEKIANAGTLNDVEKSYPMGRLNKQPKIPI